MKFKLNCGLAIGFILTASITWADSLELRNGSLIEGKFLGGTESEITLRVGSSVQTYNLADIVALKFDSETAASDMPTRPTGSPSSQSGMVHNADIKTPVYVAVPAGTVICVRTIDNIDSTQNHVADRFQASLEEPLMVNGNVVVPKDAYVYGRLVESKESGTFTGRSHSDWS